MFKRKAYSKLLEWKQRENGASAVLIEGARRVGKSTLAAQFGKRVGTQYILHPRPLKTQGERVYLPLYMAHLL